MFGDLLHADTIPLPEHDPLEKELGDFVDAARTGRTPSVPGEHGLEVLRIADAILERIQRSQAAALK